ncbi:hypothetical protein KVR01_012213 [Diaporthe batatas]|uniref:uncharacterized protein n=1 Tax=Diaporthe batatas TaxID=748121 RepID=UPI001D040C53|nr:uncharacterized protein KVR01_012213 [Diaporthe batatas]KAG8157941.1 hypothetical protein KVR01_012213 [Diaporthe batatas]
MVKDMDSDDLKLQEESAPTKSRPQSGHGKEVAFQTTTTTDVHKRPWIRYRTEYLDQNNDDVVWEENSRTPSANHNDGLDFIGDPIFEILTIYRARGDSKSVKRSSKTGERTREGPPPRSFGTPPRHKLRIYSSALRNALNSVVQYYPSQSLNGDALEVDWPYPVLVHHYDELAEFRKQILLKEPSELCVRETHAPEDIQALLDYLDQTVMDNIRAEMARIKRGFLSFDSFWYAFKPGTTILSSIRTTTAWQACVISDITGGTFVDPPEEWVINGWSLAFDGRFLGRVSSGCTMERFSGEKDQSSFRFISDTKDIRDEEAKRLVDYGRQYWELIQKKCKYHAGDSCNFPHNTVEGLVMTDARQYYAENLDSTRSQLEGSDLRRWTNDCVCSVCKQRSIKLETGTQTMFENYSKITRLRWSQLSDHQYLLCPSEVPAFVFKSRSWDIFHVNNFRDPQFQQDMINSLVTDEERVITLKALAQSFIRVNQDGDTIDRPAWTADFVKGKGTGMTFLLHGRPGVGKTYTAECIAEYTKRPLMTLTNSDIGIDPDSVELNLTRHFKTAKSWGAILLIDEADVFMERRSSNDLTRNSLVAGFLRALEFYDGILFLTTNRVGSFDDAFISRVHIQLYYRDFTDGERQRVWQTFIDKLHNDNTDAESGKLYMRVSLPAQEYIEGEQIRAIKWNGREIRNAFQTAVALAEHEGRRDKEGTILVTDRHLKSVLALSKDFKNYLTELHQGHDEGERARRRQERLDSFGNES